MKEKLEDIFEELGVVGVRHGSLPKDDVLPDTIFTYWNTKTNSKWFYDNECLKVEWEWAIFLYMQDENEIYTQMKKFITMAIEKGFSVDGVGSDVPSDEPDYFARYVKIVYVENKTEG